jgi:hypothetical protein
VQKPDSLLTPEERRRAIAAILARGVRRLLEGCAAVTEEEDASAATRPNEDTKRTVSGDAS